MTDFLRRDKWSPYQVGFLIGILLLALLSIGQQIGASGGITRIAALIEKGLLPEHVSQTPYFNKILSDQVIFNWKVLFIIGLFIGAFLASKLTKESIPQKNTIWTKNYGDSPLKRHLAAFIGGIILILGARVAGGCTSGHALSGGAQMSVTSWIFMGALFAAAIPTSLILYRKH